MRHWRWCEAGFPISTTPVFALMLLAGGLLWSFMQGVFILTTFFGYS
jgi:hypothetical protein